MPTPAVLALALLVAAPPAAPRTRTTFREYNNYCTTGAFQTCASVQVIVVSTRRASLLIINFQNRQGNSYGFDNTGGSSLSSFWMTPMPHEWEIPDPNNTGLPWNGVAPTTTGRVGALGKVPDEWDAYVAGGYAEWHPANLGKGVFGCEGLPIDPTAEPYDWGPNGYSGAYVTCASKGYSGWVQFSVLVDIPTTADDWEPNWYMSNQKGAGQPGTFVEVCHTGDPTSCTSMTPEPVTLTLMGTGLAGVALIRRKRRK